MSDTSQKLTNPHVSLLLPAHIPAVENQKKLCAVEKIIDRSLFFSYMVCFMPNFSPDFRMELVPDT
jgi:hypothetical protein